MSCALLSLAWGAAVMETGDDLHLSWEDAESQPVGEAPKPDAADVPADAGKLLRIVAQTLQPALELVEEAGGQPPLADAAVPPQRVVQFGLGGRRQADAHHAWRRRRSASASKASPPSPGSASNMANRRSNSAARGVGERHRVMVDAVAEIRNQVEPLLGGNTRSRRFELTGIWFGGDGRRAARVA